MSAHKPADETAGDIVAKWVQQGKARIAEDGKVVAMSAHTPGPWTIDGRDVISTEWPVARTFGATLEQQRANAQLIAAAPELLEACKRAEHVLSTLAGVGVPEALEALREAIAKSR